MYMDDDELKCITSKSVMHPPFVSSTGSNDSLYIAGDYQQGRQYLMVSR